MVQVCTTQWVEWRPEWGGVSVTTPHAMVVHHLHTLECARAHLFFSFVLPCVRNIRWMDEMRSDLICWMDGFVGVEDSSCADTISLPHSHPAPSMSPSQPCVFICLTYSMCSTLLPILSLSPIVCAVSPMCVQVQGEGHRCGACLWQPAHQCASRPRV